MLFACAAAHPHIMCIWYTITNFFPLRWSFLCVCGWLLASSYLYTSLIRYYYNIFFSLIKAKVWYIYYYDDSEKDAHEMEKGEIKWNEMSLHLEFVQSLFSMSICSYWFSGSTRKLRLKYALLSFHIHHHFEWTENENKKITRRKMQSGWIEVHSYRMHCTHCGVTHTHTHIDVSVIIFFLFSFHFSIFDFVALHCHHGRSSCHH